MTIEEFNEVGFSGGMHMVYQGVSYEICAVELEEKLIAFQLEPDSEQYSWARCENCEVV